jgi:hypothetical protein
MDAQIAQLIDLVKSLHEKVDVLTEENKELRQMFVEKPNPIPVPPSRRVQSEKQQCCGLTAKGLRCKNKVVEDNKCKMHINQDAKQVKPKVKKVKKVKPVPPTHNHPPSVIPTEYCQLCETHGNILDPELPLRQFEIINTGSVSVEDIPEEEPEVEDEQILNKLAGLGINVPESWADDDDDDFFEN